MGVGIVGAVWEWVSREGLWGWEGCPVEGGEGRLVGMVVGVI